MKLPRWLCWHPNVTLRIAFMRQKPEFAPFVCNWCGSVSWVSDDGPWEKPR